MKKGFTLIEMSVVMVIIGLLVGGIMVGREMVANSKVRAQISQIDKFNGAVAAFDGKYGALPGDMSSTLAAQYNFTARLGARGRGDGNGVIEGYYYSGSGAYGWDQGGETLLFWNDLSSAQMIDKTFNRATDTNLGYFDLNSVPGMNAYLPEAPVGDGDYVYVYSNASVTDTGNGFNYFGISAVKSIDASQAMTTAPNIPVITASKIDSKVDDGIATTGDVKANYDNAYQGAYPVWTVSADPDTTATCYNSTTGNYSLSSLANYGKNSNCALSFKFAQ